MKISIIIPCYNEQESIAELHKKIKKAMGKKSYEILFIDDGSTDETWKEISKLKDVRAFRLRSNFGKSDAMHIGLRNAKGETIITMDADLQDDPEEIKNLIAKMNEGYDMVVGWKKNRQDPKEKTLPSKVFNWTVRAIFGLKIHDFNCGLKAFKSKIFANIDLYGELHRYIPVLAQSNGYKVTEIEVVHHPRKHGVSKFGWKRYMHGFLDMFTVLTITRYARRPGHLFGGLGVLAGMASGLILTYLSMIWMFTDDPIGSRPLLLFGIMLGIVSIQFLCFGMLAELVINRTASNKESIVEERL